MPFFIAASEIATIAQFLWPSIQITYLHDSYLPLKY